MRTKNKTNSIGLAAYFGIAVFLIILVSIIFKSVDLFRSSKFDGKHRLTTQVVGEGSSQIISVSPQDGTISDLKLKGQIGESTLLEMSVPVDAFTQTSRFDPGEVSPKSIFRKLLFGVGRNKTNLNFIDLIRLSIYSAGVEEDNIDSEEASAGDITKINEFAAGLKDSEIVSEKISIEVTNTTDTSGLGNKVAKYLTNLGANVILVNTSNKAEKKSKILYQDQSYTLSRISKSLGIPVVKGEGNQLADVIIVLGQDKTDLFK